MVKIIAVLGGKGGCGKSTCSIGLSLALAEQKQRVLLIDLDEGMRCLDMLLGVSEKLLFDVSDAINGRDLASCVLQVPGREGLSLLAAPGEKGLIDAKLLAGFLENIPNSMFDTVVLDLPAGSDLQLYRALPPYTEFLCICNPNAVSVRDAANIGTLLNKANRKGKIILNRYQRYFIKNPVFSTLDDIIDESGLMLLGIVPESERLSLAFLEGNYKIKGKAKKAFKRIALRLCGRNIPLPKLKKI